MVLRTQFVLDQDRGPDPWSEMVGHGVDDRLPILLRQHGIGEQDVVYVDQQLVEDRAEAAGGELTGSFVERDGPRLDDAAVGGGVGVEV